MYSRYNTDFDRTFAAMDQLRRRMDRLFDRYDGRREDDDAGDVFPRGRLTDRGQDLLLELEIPGVAEKDLTLTIQREVLSLTGERKNDAPEGYYVHRKERAPIKFGKSFSLPCKVDPEQSSAVLKNGILAVTLAKAPEAQPRQITVKAQ